MQARSSSTRPGSGRLIFMAGLFLALSATKTMAQIGSDLELFWSPEELLVTATRSPKLLRRAPALATVVSAEQIRAMGARTLVDVVRRLPGFNVSITNIGNPVIDVRGLQSYNGEKLLLMIDGHRVNESHSGGAAWTFTDMPLDNVERIEFIRGPGSALYGENAFAGVINVFSRRRLPGDQPPSAEKREQGFVSVAAGTQDTRQGGMLFGTSGAEFAVNGFAHFLKTDGDSLEVEQDVLSRSPVTAPFGLTPHPTEDWKEQQDFDLWTSWKRLSLHTRYMHKNQGPYIGITDVMTDGSQRNTDHFFADLMWRETFGETAGLTAKLFFDHHTMDNYWVGYPPGFLGMPEFAEDGLIGNPSGKYRTYGLELVGEALLAAAHQLTFGTVYRSQQQFDIRYWANFDTTKSGPPPAAIEFQEVTDWGNWQSEADYQENDWSIFAQDDWAAGEDLSLIAGLRFDAYAKFDDVISPRAGLVWQAGDALTCKLLYGHAYRAPSFVDRFTANNPAYIGNPDLQPETIDTLEGAISGVWAGLAYDLGLYYSKYDDIIVLGEKPSPTEPARYVNRDKATAKGVELSVQRLLVDSVTAKANYSYQSLKNDATDTSLPGVPTHQGNVELQWELLAKTSLNTHLYWCGERTRADGDPREPLAGYELVNLSLLARDVGTGGLEVQFTVNNLFDRQYADPAPQGTIYNDYPRPGRHALAELRYNF